MKVFSYLLMITLMGGAFGSGVGSYLSQLFDQPESCRWMEYGLFCGSSVAFGVFAMFWLTAKVSESSRRTSHYRASTSMKGI